MMFDCDIAILGSGAGGATLAQALAKRGKSVLILEKGSIVPRVGSEKAALGFYDKFGKLKTREGMVIYRAIMAGGTTVVSCGNGVRSLEREFKTRDIDIGKELDEAERELGVVPMDKRSYGDGTMRIVEAGEALGIHFDPMPKYIDFNACVSCGNCVLGCAPKAKWTANSYLEEAQNHRAKLVVNFSLDRIETSNGEVAGLRGRSNGEEVIVKAGKIVLACGALTTPLILQDLGLSAGNKLFCDPYAVVYGLVAQGGLARETSMAAVNSQFHESEGFIMAPFLDTPLSLVFTNPKYYRLMIKRDKLLGIMVKIKDDLVGTVRKDGISKTLTANDKTKLDRGCRKATEVLVKAGVDPESITITEPRGAHPGGTAAIGDVINTDHQTRISGLYVCDASALPEAPGLPPILTIVALAKRLANIL